MVNNSTELRRGRQLQHLDEVTVNGLTLIVELAP